MIRKHGPVSILGVLLVLILIAVGVLPVSAAPPANDELGSATVIGSLPFSENLDTTEATQGLDDPWWNCHHEPLQATVWYSFTPTDDSQLETSTEGSDYYTDTSVFVDDMGSLSVVACDDNGSATFEAYTGQTYYIMIGQASGSGPYPPPGENYGGNLVFSLQERQLVPPEANFDYWMFGALSYEFYNNSWDPEGIGIESAFWEFGDGDTSTELYWTTHTYAQEDYYNVTLTVTTYDNRTSSVTRLVEAFIPDPEVGFGYDPYDPSMFDMVRFYNYSWDPANENMEAFWDFGDGTTDTDWSPSHRYGADGNYVVELMVTTEDGRTATTSQEVLVSTHDVAIKKFQVPKSAKVGQTRQLSVGISNILQPEIVEVYLYKSTNEPWQDWEYIGSLVQRVPVRRANRTTSFNFTYTFTPEDGEIGKLNFKAEAYIHGARDALNGDNMVISLPVKVAP